MNKMDKELDKYRNLLDAPGEYKDGFGWSTVIGIFFCGLLMMPGSIYLGLMTGGNMSAAATWVTVILFSQVAKRAMQPMDKQQLVVLLHAARVMMIGYLGMPGGPLGTLVWRAFFVNSNAVREQGISGSFPTWWAPAPDSPAILERTLFHVDWLIPAGLILFALMVSLISKYTLGYFFFRLTSDVEGLPFPMAPISAQGALAMTEEDVKGEKPSLLKRKNKKQKQDAAKPPPTRWRLFSLGSCLGLTFGFIQVGIPAITGLFLEKPVFLLPQPFLDTTRLTEGLLPAAPTGITLDLGIILTGMILPFWAVIGTALAVLTTFLLNPILFKSGLLTTWQPGMDTVNTQFSNHVDFWMAFSIGTALGIALVSVFSCVRALLRASKSRGASEVRKRENPWAVPGGRGDYPLWMAAAGYILVSSALITVVNRLIPQFPAAFMMFFSFAYVPLMSYVNARLRGISGQQVEIPMIREGAFILSGAKGVEIWLAPVPTEDYGTQAESFRVNELTGVNFRSLFKAELVALPVLFLCSLLFWSFIWKTNEIPSAFFPAAQVRWELGSKQSALLFSSTHVAEGQDPELVNIRDSPFFQAAFKPKILFGSLAGTVVVFSLLSFFGLPVMLIYGFIRGIGDLPHFMVLELVGAIIGRYYFQKKFGSREFLRMAPTVLAGYFTGVGLMGMATIAMNLIQQAVTGAPF